MQTQAVPCPPGAYWSRLTACSTISMVTRPSEGMAGAPTAASEAVKAMTSSCEAPSGTPWACGAVCVCVSVCVYVWGVVLWWDGR